jgi:hypothetical protein
MIQAMSETFTRQMTSLDRRMDTLEKGLRPESATPYQPARLWADRPLNEPLPPIPISWPDDEELENETDADDAEGCPLHNVTETLLTEAFTKPVGNTTWRRWRTSYGIVFVF